MDIARYRATLQALTEARRSAVTEMLCGHVDDAEREQWHWIVELLDSIERSARRSLRESVLVDGSPSSGPWPSSAPAAPPREFDWQI